MANHKSAAKRARQDKKKRDRNHGTKKAIRTVEKKLRVAIEAKNKETASPLMKTFESLIGKAAQKGILHANNAARRTSRLASRISSI